MDHDLVGKFNALIRDVQGCFVKRDAEVAAAVLAVVSKQHLCFLGPQGVAKSAVIWQIVKRVTGARYFRKSVYGDTQEVDLFGMPSLRGLDVDDIYRRNVDGFLPTAHFANLEEWSRANGSLLPSLHDVAYERRYRNGPDDLDLPLLTLFTSANFMHKDRDLDALWDRLLIRRCVEPLHERADRKAMLRLPPAPEPAVTVTLDETLAAIAAVNDVTIPDYCVEQYLDVIIQVADKGVRVSDRRQYEALSAVRAGAWLAGRRAAISDDLKVLRDVLWVRPEDISVVADILKEVTTSAAEAANAIKEELLLVGRDVETAPAADAFEALSQGIEKCQQAGANLKALEKRAEKEGTDAAAVKLAADLIIKYSREWPARLKDATPSTKGKGRS